MSDLDDVKSELATKAALSAGKDAAKRAVEDLFLSEEEKAEREAKRAEQSKGSRNKLIASRFSLPPCSFGIHSPSCRE